VPDDQVGSGLAARRVRAGTDVCILAVGKMLEAAESAADELETLGISATVWDPRVIKPLDATMLVDAARHPLVVTVEDGIRVGGVGSYMADAIAGLDEKRQPPRVVVLGTPPEFLAHGEPGAILASLGLDGPGITAAVRKARAAIDATSDLS
jgi:1-deoxy-D-xylulose-5-phosphate synthase